MSTANFTVQEHKLPTSHIREYPRATIDQEDELHLAVKQYTPRDNFTAKNQITIIGAHANGFPKEMYEPLWDELFARLKAKGIKISNIFIADVAHQGASGVMNEYRLGNDPSWHDHPRDLFLMVNHFRKYMKRPLVGIGHSMGGNNLINLSLMHPRLFTSIILLDPVVQRQPNPEGNFAPTKASARRRDIWPSRKVAEDSFKKSKFYQTWDPRVLEKWMKHGIRELPTAIYPHATAASSTLPAITADPSSATVSPEPSTEVQVTLATTKHQEVFSFLRANFPTKEYPLPSTEPNPYTHPDVDPTILPTTPFYRNEPHETFRKLPYLRPSVFYIFGEKSGMSPPDMKADKMLVTGAGVGGSGGVKKGRVAEVTLKDVGHLVPMEAVGETADNAADWITSEVQIWRAIEDPERKEWASVPMNKRSQMSAEHQRIMMSDWSIILADEEKARKAKL